MKNRNMFVVVSLAVASLGASVFDVHAEGRATSHFRYPEVSPGKRLDNHQGLLEYVISNVGDEPIYIQSELQPITSKSSTRLIGDSLSVLGSDGTEARYQGSFVSLARKGAMPMTAIHPGETRVCLIDIQKSYVIEPGRSYKVGLKSGGIFAVQSQSKTASGDERWDVRAYQNEDVSIWIDPQHYIRPKTKEEIIEHQKSLMQQRLNESQAVTQPAVTTCSNPMVQRFQEAKGQAVGAALSGVMEVSNAYNHVYDAIGSYVESTFSSQRWARWFSPHQSPVNVVTGQDPSDQYAENGVFVIYARVTESEGVPIVQDCYCDYTRVPAATIAYVDDPTSSTINTCPLFGTVDMIPIGIQTMRLPWEPFCMRFHT